MHHYLLGQRTKCNANAAVACRTDSSRKSRKVYGCNVLAVNGAVQVSICAAVMHTIMLFHVSRFSVTDISTNKRFHLPNLATHGVP